jgi:hypothetical protein
MASTRGLKTFLFTPILTRMARKSGFMLGSVSKPERENTCSTLASYEGGRGALVEDTSSFDFRETR